MIAGKDHLELPQDDRLIWGQTRSDNRQSGSAGYRSGLVLTQITQLWLGEEVQDAWKDVAVCSRPIPSLRPQDPVGAGDINSLGESTR